MNVSLPTHGTALTRTTLQAASSFDCDGCAHHASFHSLENAAEDAVLQKWAEQQAVTTKERQTITGASSKKRKLITEKPNEDEGDDLEVIGDSGVHRAVGSTKTKGSKGMRELR